jgi:[ribosomal protein S18]-alanine N-acetyltransferase
MNQIRINHHIRWLIRCDMTEILSIEQSCNEPWTEEEILTQLRSRNCIGMVLEDEDGKVLGYMIYELWKDFIHLVRFGVHPRHRRKGIGASLIHKLISKLSLHRRDWITVHVPEDNLNMQLFLRSLGFKAIGILRQEAKYTMQYHLPE